MQVTAPAKINLNLRVVGRNVSGFHDIETWMVPVTLADEVRVELREATGVQLACSDPQLPADQSNLAWRAAELFLRETGRPGGASIDLVKNIPHGAGLGGGSSDAAAVLQAMNALCGQPLSAPRLEALGAQLGSDVPFFVRGVAAMARGRGERLESRPLSRSLDLLLLKPPFPVNTAWAYAAWSGGRLCPEEWCRPQLAGGLEVFNDLERPVFAKYILLPAMKQWMLAHSLVEAAAMTGSGSTMFAILRDPRGAEQLAREAKEQFGETLWSCACQTCG